MIDMNALSNALLALGYEVSKDDTALLTICKNKVENSIKNICNINEIPNGLDSVVLDRICGEFLFAKNQIGKLDENYDAEDKIQQISEGDTSITFSGMSHGEKLDLLINSLMNSGTDELRSCRKMGW